jgi:DNA-binding NtrC family response regulator
MTVAANILAVDDTPQNLKLLGDLLAAKGYRVTTAADGRGALEKARAGKFDMVLLDVMMPGPDGFEVCQRLKADAATRDIPVIFLTALDDTFDKVKAFSAGAVDFVTKPFRSEELLARVSTHLALREARRALEEQNAKLREEIEAHNRAKGTIECLVEEIRSTHDFGEILGDSPSLRHVLDQVSRVAATDSTVLILGETGTGKELIARAIHGRSPRLERPLVKLNCAALPRDLVESELFGHEKGAFTGATQLRRGRFELADGGTLFLDEVGELPLDTQAKLLRVLQGQEFERVGGSQTLRTDVRLIAATNRDLQQQVSAGTFRSDLYYRLNVFPLALPPLRERHEDVPRLISHFLERAGRRLGKTQAGLAAALVAQAASYHWPGNVRELENYVERSAILGEAALLETRSPDASRDEGAPQAASGELAAFTLEAIERSHIARVLEQTGWKIEGERGAARLLGLNPSTLRGRLRKLGIRKT